MIFKGSIEHKRVIFHVYETDEENVILQHTGNNKSHDNIDKRKEITITRFGAIIKTYNISMDNLNPEFAKRVADSKYI